MPSTATRARGPKSERDGHDEPYPRFTTTSEGYADALYHDAAQEDEIGTFLKDYEGYDSAQKRWTIPEAPSKRGDLIDALHAILSSIMGRFVKGTEPGVEREIVNTLRMLGFDVKNDKGYRKWPVLLVRAAGPSFEIPHPRESASTSKGASRLVAFSCTATFFSVCLDSDAGRAEDQLDEIASHVRYVHGSKIAWIALNSAP